MKRSTLLGLAAVIFFIAAIIDIIDGYIPKMISSVSITIALLVLALGQGKVNKSAYDRVALAFMVVALLAFVYRLLNYYEVM
ncbi:MAG TPA: hypothetical protein DIS90_15405 [Cytophagales bacterium]|nr:hypothetical protein [Cytophagales bacterium]